MDQVQLTALKHWLLGMKAKNRPCFVVSPAILIPRKLCVVGSDPPLKGSADPANVLHSDSWDGYPSSFDAIFQHIADNEIPNVIFLSGDEHRGCAAKASLKGTSITVHSIHSTGLYAPYVFANAVEEDFVLRETVPVGKYEWEIDAEFAPRGQGFTLIQVAPRGAGWEVNVKLSLTHSSPTEKLTWIEPYRRILG
jgi:phosphodiesterase/alkaline phosphatase D-like protein